MSDAISTALGKQVKLLAFDYGAVNTKWVTDPSIGPRLAACIAWLATASAKSGGPGKVVLVAHSMGGLAIRCAVDPACVNTDRSSYPGIPWPPPASPGQLGLVITIGTPNLGSNYQMLGPIGEALCPKLRFLCGPLLDLRNTDAAKAMAPGSTQLSALPLLPVRVPVDAIAGQITYISSLFGQPAGDIPPPDPGDLVVPVYSALADQSVKKLHAGPGARTTPPINCGEIPLDNINTWLLASDALGAPAFPVTCWHGTEITDPAFQADVVKAIGEFQAAVPPPGPCRYLSTPVAAAAAGQQVSVQVQTPSPPKMVFLYGDMAMDESYGCFFHGPPQASSASSQYQSSVLLAVSSPVAGTSAFFKNIQAAAQASLAKATPNARVQTIPAINVPNAAVPPISASFGAGEGVPAQPPTLYLLEGNSIVLIQLQQVNGAGQAMTAATLNALTSLGQAVAANFHP
jgi:hypothetical protein